MLQLVVALTLSAAQPVPTSPAVADGVVAYDELRYRDAIGLLESALKDPTLAREDQIAALGSLARAQAIVQHGDEARRRFVQLLEIDPAYLVGYDEPPAVTQSFQAAREDFARLHPDRPLQAFLEPEKRPIWPWIAGGAAVAAAAVIVTIIVVSNNGADRPGDLNDTWVLP